MQTQQAGGMFGFFFSSKPVRNYHDACASDTHIFSQFFHSMIAQGVYFAPSAFEASFVSACHSDVELEHTLSAFDHTFCSLASAKQTDIA